MIDRFLRTYVMVRQYPHEFLSILGAIMFYAPTIILLGVYLAYYAEILFWFDRLGVPTLAIVPPFVLAYALYVFARRVGRLIYYLRVRMTHITTLDGVRQFDWTA